MAEPARVRSTQKIAIFVAVIVIVVGSITGAYFTILEPMNRELSTLRRDLQDSRLQLSETGNQLEEARTHLSLLQTLKVIVVSDEWEQITLSRGEETMALRVDNNSPLDVELKRVVITGHDKNGDATLTISGSGEMGLIRSESCKLHTVIFQRSSPEPEAILLYRTWAFFDTPFGEISIIVT